MKFWSQKSGSQRTPDFALTPFETQQERESPLLRFCLPLLILAMGILGSVYSMLSAFEIRISYSALAAWLVIYLIAAVAVYSFPNWSLLVMAPGLPLVLWAFFSMDELADGCICLMNDLLTGMTQNSPWVFVQYAVKVSSPSEKMWLETRFLVMACCLVTLIAGYFVVRRPTLPVFMLLTAPALLLPLFFTMMPDLGAFFALVGSWLMLYTQNRLARQNWNGQAVRRFGFSKKPRHSRRLVAQKNVRRQSALLMLGCVLLAWLAAGSLLPQTGYERPESLSELLSGIQKSFSWMQPQGIMTSDLHNLPDLRFTGATALEVSCETEQPLYLRGYAAGVFTGSKWEVLPDEEYEEAAASFSEYEGNPINPINLSGYVNYNTRDRYDVTIRNRATNRNTLFIPPGLVTQVDQMNNIRYRQDLYVETGWLATPERYRLSAMPMPSLINSEMNVYLGSAPQDRVPDEFLPPAEEGFGYEKLLDEYEIFLYEPYTALPDEVAEYARQWWREQGVTNVFDKETQTITEQVNLYAARCKPSLTNALPIPIRRRLSRMAGIIWNGSSTIPSRDTASTMLLPGRCCCVPWESPPGMPRGIWLPKPTMRTPPAPATAMCRSATTTPMPGRRSMTRCHAAGCRWSLRPDSMQAPGNRFPMREQLPAPRQRPPRRQAFLLLRRLRLPQVPPSSHLLRRMLPGQRPRRSQTAAAGCTSP